MAHRSALALVLGLVSVLALGCDSPGFKSKVKSPEAAAARQPPGRTTTTGAGLPNASSGDAAHPQAPAVFTPGLSVSNAIAEACGLSPRESDANVAASFEFDSAALAEDDRMMLGDLARCLTEGALKDKSVLLIGRADARGEPEYNMILGESRADAVQRYLVDLGVGKQRMRATSRGELDATGTDEDGWAQDRRVDIELVL